jgi:hypothetical protein
VSGLRAAAAVGILFPHNSYVIDLNAINSTNFTTLRIADPGDRAV